MTDITQKLIDEVYIKELEDGETFDLLRLCQKGGEITLLSGAVGISVRAVEIHGEWKIECTNLETWTPSENPNNWARFEDASTVFTLDCTELTHAYSKEVVLFSNKMLGLKSKLTHVFVSGTSYTPVDD